LSKRSAGQRVSSTLLTHRSSQLGGAGLFAFDIFFIGAHEKVFCRCPSTVELGKRGSFCLLFKLASVVSSAKKRRHYGLSLVACVITLFD
jgi:hypothetical protein